MANIQSSVPLDASYVRDVLGYSPATGYLWFSQRGVPAGCINGRGYRQINLLNRSWLAHRVIWLWMTGEWAPLRIDHINCDKADNRWANLRLVTNAQNLMNRDAQRNNTSGFKGVHRMKDCDRFRASIMVAGKSKHLGLFKTAEEASEAYQKAAETLHGAFAHPGPGC